MSTTRSLRNRSSRYSSPATFAEKEAPARPVEAKDGRNGVQTSLDRWTEPVVRSAVPSFEDTKGLERLGVLEHMAPLGVAPSQKLLQKLKINFTRSSPRITPLQTDDTDTPMVDAARPEILSPTNTEPLPEPTDLAGPIILSPPRGRPAKKDADGMRQAADMMTPSPVKSSFQSSGPSPKPQSIQDFIRQDRMKNGLHQAIQEAHRESDLKLIPGLESILEDAKSKTSLWSVIDAIATKAPTDAQFRVFKRYIKRGMKRYQQGAVIRTSPLQPADEDDHVTSPRHHSAGRLRTHSGHHPPSTSPSQNGVVASSPRRSRTSHHRRHRSASGQKLPMSPNNPTARVAGEAQQLPISTSGRKRSGSASTTSSLSSAKSLPDNFSQDVEDDSEAQTQDGRPARSTGQRQAANRVAAGSRTHPLVALHQPDQIHAHPVFPATTIRFINRKHPKSKHKEESPFDHERIEAKKAELEREIVPGYNDIARQQSHERSSVVGLPMKRDLLARAPRPPVIHSNPLQQSSATLFSSPASHQLACDNTLVNGTARKRAYDEFERDDIETLTPLSSSPAPSFPPPPNASLGVGRGSTPRSTRLPPPNKARKSARVMISPNKPKNGGVIAGVSRAGIGRETTAGNSAESGGEDNDEFCASCGGEGILLCCDGCTNSFHHACLEPPMDPDQEVDGEWFCPQCMARRNKCPVQATGLLGQVIRRVDDTIPKAFALPFDIRDYFEGVRTGDEGEYEEISLPRAQNNVQKMNRAGFFEAPNYKELRDSKGNFITCYGCKKTSNGGDIIPCDYCPAKWHTDCIDPPMAVPPRRIGGDKPNGYWRCPLHVEQDLANLSRQAELTLDHPGREPRLRKPKKAILVDVDMSRGFRNNGVIEVDLIKDEAPSIKEVALDGGIYRLPERGIRLDFIDRVKQSWYEDHMLSRQAGTDPVFRHRLYRPDRAVLHHPAEYTIVKDREADLFQGATAAAIAETAKANARLRQKSFMEQSAIMSLVNMSGQGQESRVSTDPLTDLVNQLIADSPEELEREATMSERQSLLKLQALVTQRLAVLGTDEEKGFSTTEKSSSQKGDPELINGHTPPADRINGEVENDGDDEGDGGSDMEIS